MTNIIMKLTKNREYFIMLRRVRSYKVVLYIEYNTHVTYKYIKYIKIH